MSLCKIALKVTVARVKEDIAAAVFLLVVLRGQFS